MDKQTGQTKKMGDMAMVIKRLYEKDLKTITKKPSKKKKAKYVKVRRMYIFLGVFIAIASSAFVMSYNQIITYQEKINSAQGAIEAELQRRDNLFVNLVTLYKSYSNLEKDIFGHVADVRSDLSGTSKLVDELKTNKGLLTQGMNDKVANLGTSLAKLLAVVEQYPQLRASEPHNLLVEKLVVTEDRITTTRDNYNEMVRIYNNMIAHFPYKYMALLCGFDRGKYYSTTDNAKLPPKLDMQF